MLVLSVSAMAKTIYRLPKVLKIKAIIKRGAGEKLPWLFQFSNPQILKVRLSGSWAFAEGERLFPFSKQLAIRAKKSGKKEKQESCKQQVSLIAVEFACPFFFFLSPAHAHTHGVLVFICSSFPVALSWFKNQRVFSFTGSLCLYRS